MYYSVRRCTSPSRKTSYQPWLHLIYCCSSYPIWGSILRLAGHGLFVVAEIVGFVVAEIVGFVVAEIVGYLLLCAKLAAALAAGSTAFFEYRWSIWLNFANSHRSSSLSPPSSGDLHLIWLIALLYWYADKCYWKIVAYIDIWLDIDIWLEIVYCLCCDIIAY